MRRRFPVFKVKELIRDVLAANLGDVQYHIDHSSKLTSTIADAIKNELKKLNLERCVVCVCGWLRARTPLNHGRLDHHCLLLDSHHPR
jgi:hypothetical protein